MSLISGGRVNQTQAEPSSGQFRKISGDAGSNRKGVLGIRTEWHESPTPAAQVRPSCGRPGPGTKTGAVLPNPAQKFAWLVGPEIFGWAEMYRDGPMGRAASRKSSTGRATLDSHEMIITVHDNRLSCTRGTIQDICCARMLTGVGQQRSNRKKQSLRKISILHQMLHEPDSF